jgi:hypothetical protein
MNRRPLVIGVVAAVFVLACWLLYSRWQHSQLIEKLPTLAAAVKRYSHDQIWRGRTLTPTVPIQDLVDGGYLFPGEARDLAGVDLTFYPVPNESDPKAVLVRLKSSDGSELDALADGSVQPAAKESPHP